MCAELEKNLLTAFWSSVASQADTQRVLTETISHLNTLSSLKITAGFAVSSKTGTGIDELKAALAGMVPAKAVPSSYEQLLTELRAQSAVTKSPFVTANHAQLLALSPKVR